MLPRIWTFQPSRPSPSPERSARRCSTPHRETRRFSSATSRAASSTPPRGRSRPRNGPCRSSQGKEPPQIARKGCQKSERQLRTGAATRIVCGGGRRGPSAVPIGAYSGSGEKGEAWSVRRERFPVIPDSLGGIRMAWLISAAAAAAGEAHPDAQAQPAWQDARHHQVHLRPAGHVLLRLDGAQGPSPDPFPFTPPPSPPPPPFSSFDLRSLTALHPPLPPSPPTRRSSASSRTSRPATSPSASSARPRAS